MKSTTYISTILLMLICFNLFSSCDINSPLNIELIEISDEQLDFGLFQNRLSFTLANTDTLSVYWQVNVWPEWIRVEPNSSLIEAGGIDTINVIIDRSELVDGQYEGEVKVEFDATSEILKLDINLLMAAILYSEIDSLIFGIDDSIHSFPISNMGNLPLKWQCQSLAPWIKVTPDTGTILPSFFEFPDSSGRKLKTIEDIKEVSVRIDKTQLIPGNHRSAIVINSNGGKDTLTVSVEISPDPLLNINSASLNFTVEESAKTLTLSNDGGGSLEWAATANVSWITVDPPSGVLTSEYSLYKSDEKSILQKTDGRTAEVDIIIDRSTLTPGTHVARLDFNSNGGDKIVGVTVEVEGDPVLEVSPTTLNFSASESEKTFGIGNTGGNILSWQISTNNSWIIVSPTNGSTQTQRSVISVSITRNGMTPGEYSGALEINSNGGNQTVSVTMDIAGSGPLLSYSPNSLNFGNNVNTLPFEITNTGDHSLSWQLSTDQSWIELSNNQGTTTTENDDIEVTVNRSGLAPGDYSGTITIISDGGNGSINIFMKVDDPTPLLFYSPSAIDFGNADSLATFDIKNVGGGNLGWNLSADQPWISIRPSYGNTETETDVIEVQVDRKGLQIGNYSGLITILSEGGNGQVAINMSVSDIPPVLSYNPEFLQFSTDNDSLQNIVINNTGGGILEWQLITDANWIIISLTSGRTENEPTQVLVTVDPDSELPGEHTGHINITSNGGNGVIEVKMFIPDSAKLEVSTNVLDFGTETNMLSFEIRNSGEKLLTWYCDEDYPWFSVNPINGETSSETDIIDVSVSREGIEPGEYFGIITVASNGGEEKIEVKMEVPARPKLDVSKTLIDFGSSSDANYFNVLNIGTGFLNWWAYIEYPDATSNFNWLSIDPTYGTTSDEQRVNVFADRNSLPAGQYNAKIIVESDSNSIAINVKITQPSPILTLSTHYLDFGETETHKTFDIQNSGGSEMPWSLEYDQTWMNVYPTSGTITTETATVNVNVSRDASKAMFKIDSSSEFYGKVLVYAAGGTDTVKVRMVKPDPPSLSMDPYYMYFENSDTTMYLSIKNVGGGTLEWGLIVNDLWINYDQANGSCTTETDKVAISIKPGNYGYQYGSINVQTNGGNQTLSIQMNIPGKANK